MAEISAMEDKFEAWIVEDQNKPARPPAYTIRAKSNIPKSGGPSNKSSKAPDEGDANLKLIKD